ncbi:MAG: extracellular solute-binding protein [Lachnospiraceae bacterium]|nr:extracellular solute-binding protein [Lachnospiraceae bacterium]
MHLKRRIIAVLALICMVGACVAGSRVDMTGAEERLAGLSVFNRKETLYFWYADDTMTDFFNSAAVSFGEGRDVRVIPVLVEDSEFLEAVNQSSLHSSRVPDLYLLSHESLEKAYLAGLASPVHDEAGVCTTEYFPQTALSAVTYHDKIVGYPLSFETSALVYNETYLQEWAAQQAGKDLESTGEETAPEGAEEDTWEDTGAAGGTNAGENGSPEGEITEGGLTISDELPLEERQAMSSDELTAYYMERAIPSTVDDILYIGDSFDVPEGVEGIMKWDVSDIFYNYWIVGKYMIVGGDPGDDESNININNEEAVQCLEVYKALNQFFFIESDTVTFDSVVEDFINGKIVFTIATTDVIEKLEQAKAEGTFGFDYGIATMPAVSSTLESRSLSVTSAIVVNGYSKQKELANEFAAYLVTECSKDFYERTGRLSANLTTEPDNGPVQTFMAEYTDSVSLPKMMSTSNFWIQLEVLFSKVWNGSDVAELVQDLSDQIQVQVQAIE